jgi:DNA replication protein DnaC
MTLFNTLTPKNQENWNLDDPNQLDLAKGYFIHGKQGCGKTVKAIQFAKAWLKKNEINEELETNYVKFINFLDVVKTARKTFLEGEDGWNARRQMEDLFEYDLLIIDDLGTEKQTDFVQEMVYDLINHRYEHLKQTVITSNFTVQEISEKYHARIASRIAEMCDIVFPKNQIDLRFDKFN